MTVFSDIKHPWPTTDEIQLAHSGDCFKRDWTCFNTSKCTHVTCSISYARDYEIETCSECGKQISSHCNHRNNEWSPDELLLRCKTCGMDVT